MSVALDGQKIMVMGLQYGAVSMVKHHKPSLVLRPRRTLEQKALDLTTQFSIHRTPPLTPPNTPTHIPPFHTLNLALHLSSISLSPKSP